MSTMSKLPNNNKAIMTQIRALQFCVGIVFRVWARLGRSRRQIKFTRKATWPNYQGGAELSITVFNPILKHQIMNWTKLNTCMYNNTCNNQPSHVHHIPSCSGFALGPQVPEIFYCLSQSILLKHNSSIFCLIPLFIYSLIIKSSIQIALSYFRKW